MIERPPVAPAQHYQGRRITAHTMAPDVLIRVNGEDYGIYLSVSSGYRAAMRHIDRLEAETLKELNQCR